MTKLLRVIIFMTIQSNKIQNSLNLQIRSSPVTSQLFRGKYQTFLNSKFDGYEGFANLLREYVNIEHYVKILKTHQRTRHDPILPACLHQLELNL